MPVSSSGKCFASSIDWLETRNSPSTDACFLFGHVFRQFHDKNITFRHLFTLLDSIIGFLKDTNIFDVLLYLQYQGIGSTAGLIPIN